MKRIYTLLFLFASASTCLFAQVSSGPRVEKNYFFYLVTVVGLSCLLFLYFLWNPKKRVALQDAAESFPTPPTTEIVHEKEPNNKQYEFQKFVVKLFDKPKFNIHRWGNNGVATNSIQGRRDPNLVFFAFNNGLQERFAIECKWRKRPFRIFGGVKWAEPAEVSQYREFGKSERMPVFVSIGIGGTPNDPAELYLARLSELNGGVIAVKELEKYKVGKEVKPEFVKTVLGELFINSYTGVNKFV